MSSSAQRNAARALVRPTILVCDDEPSLLSVLERYLTRENFCVVTARSVHEALVALDTWKVSAVVVDIHLGAGADGIMLVKAVHAWHRGVSCIALTGYDCEEARALGIPCVHKGEPGSFRELVSKLRAAMGYGPNG